MRSRAGNDIVARSVPGTRARFGVVLSVTRNTRDQLKAQCVIDRPRSTAGLAGCRAALPRRCEAGHAERVEEWLVGVAAMGFLSGFRVTQLGRGLAAAVCGRMFADVGAEVTAIDPDLATPLALYLNHGKPVVGQDDLAAA